jgi:RNA polymerase sigma factor (sigma-70 family)
MDTQAERDNFYKLIAENKGIIIKICNSYCADAHYREDLAQEIIYHLWKSGRSFNSNYKFTTWMYRIALNVAISFYRIEKKAAPVVLLADDAALAGIADAADETEAGINLLQQFISRLGSLDRALMLLYLEEKTYSEIAGILGISTTNVATKISRIKDKLKQNFLTVNQ